MRITPATSFACPIDGTALNTAAEQPWRCANGHSFDVAREGYCNLLVVQHKASRDPGDTAEMVAARRRLLETGIYAPIANQVFAQIQSLFHSAARLTDPPSLLSIFPPSPLRGEGRSGGDLGLDSRHEGTPTSRGKIDICEERISSRVVLPPRRVEDAQSALGGGGENRETPFRVVDAGCGEGYYLARIADLAAGSGSAAALELAGTDVSKWAVRAAAKRKVPVAWAVANNRHLPFQAASIDVVLCLFGFPVWQGFSPVLSATGRVLMVDPGPEHLAELRAVIYPAVNRSPAAPLEQAEAAGFELEATIRLSYTVSLTSQAQIADLFAMTPHAYRAPEAGRLALQALASLTVTVDVVVRQLKLAKSANQIDQQGRRT